MTIMISHTTGITSRTWSSSWTVMYHSFKDENQKMLWRWSKQWFRIPDASISVLVRAQKQVAVRRACPRSLTLWQKQTSWQNFLRYANSRGENKCFEHYLAHGSILYWICWGNVMHEEAHHAHTSWCIPVAVTSNGATRYHDSMSMTLLCQIRWRRKAPHSLTARYGSRCTVVPNLPNPVRTLAAILHYDLKN